MHRIVSIVALFGWCLISASALAGEVYVQGYYRSDGTYVQPHFRSSPNSTTLDNWSTKGNINPYTGQRGTRNPYAQNNSFYNPWLPQSPNSPLYEGTVYPNYAPSYGYQ